MSSGDDIRGKAGSASSPVYVIEFCPECKGQILGPSQWHRADCPNIDKVFAIHQVIGVPLDAAVRALRNLSSDDLGDLLKGTFMGDTGKVFARFLESEFGGSRENQGDQG